MRSPLPVSGGFTRRSGGTTVAGSWTTTGCETLPSLVVLRSQSGWLTPRPGLTGINGAEDLYSNLYDAWVDLSTVPPPSGSGGVLRSSALGSNVAWRLYAHYCTHVFDASRHEDSKLGHPDDRMDGGSAKFPGRSLERTWLPLP